MRTMSFRQVVRSASEGDAMSLQAEPATALQVTFYALCTGADVVVDNRQLHMHLVP